MGTHLNAYKTEAKEALSKVRAALQEAETKLDALVAKLDEPAPAEPAAPPVDTPPVVAAPEEPPAAEAPQAPAPATDETPATPPVEAPRAADGKFAPKS